MVAHVEMYTLHHTRTCTYIHNGNVLMAKVLNENMKDVATLLGRVVSAVSTACSRRLDERQHTRLQAALQAVLTEVDLLDAGTGESSPQVSVPRRTATSGASKRAERQAAVQGSNKRTRIVLEDLTRVRQDRADREVASYNVEEAIERANAQGATETEIDTEGLEEETWVASTLREKLRAAGVVAKYYPKGEYGYDMTGSPRIRCAGLHLKWAWGHR